MREIWNKSIDIIKKNVTQQNFETWIQPLEIVSLQENNAYLSVPNKFFKDWLSENYTPVIKDALSSVTGFPVQVVFVVDKDSDGAQSNTTTQRERVEHSTKKQTPKKTLGLKVYTSLNLN